VRSQTAEEAIRFLPLPSNPLQCTLGGPRHQTIGGAGRGSLPDDVTPKALTHARATPHAFEYGSRDPMVQGYGRSQ